MIISNITGKLTLFLTFTDVGGMDVKNAKLPTEMMLVKDGH